MSTVDETDAPFIAGLLARACSAARRAAVEVREVVRGRKLDIVEKNPKDLQTAADRNSQQSIFATLKHYYPALRIIGEESDLPQLGSTELEALISHDAEVSVMERAREHRSKLEKLDFANAPIGEYTVWVDPLDGTNEFVEGAQAELGSPARALLEHVTILVGIAHRDEPVAGVIYQPFYGGVAKTDSKDFAENDGRLIWALRHCGTFGIQEQIEKNRVDYPDLDSKVIMVNTRSHDSAVVRETIAAVQPDEVLRVGGCGYKLLLVCERRANCYGYPSLGTKKWDTCAPQCLLDECGGKFTDIFGEQLRYGAEVQPMNSLGLLACISPEIYDRVKSKIPDSVREAVRKLAEPKPKPQSPAPKS